MCWVPGPWTLTALLSVGLNAVVLPGESNGAPYRLFHPRPDHPWNRLHAVLWLRKAADGKTYGHDRLDPLLWRETRHLIRGDSAKQVLKRLDEFLALRKSIWEKETLKRAILHHDLWVVFDWLANRQHDAGVTSDKVVQKLQRKLAAAMQLLALDRKEIAALPDNYVAAIASKRYTRAFDPKHPQQPFLPPRLFDRTGSWVGLGTADGPIAPAHMRGDAGFSRSAFTVFLRLPGGRNKTLEYLNRLKSFKKPWVVGQDSRLRSNPKTPQFPTGTQVALVRRMLLIDSQGQLTPTALTQQLQFRVYRRIADMRPELKPNPSPAQRFFEFNLSREHLFAGKVGGLHAVSPEERDFFSIPFSHALDPIEHHAKREETPRRALSKRMSVTLQTCVACHHQAGMLSVNAYTRRFGPRRLHPHSLFETTTRRADQMAILTKRRRYDWGLLKGLMLREK